MFEANTNETNGRFQTEKMASSAFNTFTCFPRFPAELQKMVWEEAAADPPVLDIQRFTAEIVTGQQNDYNGNQARAVLCFTPHADFISLTTGYRGLFGACRESRKAAKQLINCLLPIRYLAMDANGNLMPRQAIVPFNPLGHFCISGLARAMDNIDRYREGARGSKFLRGDLVRGLQIPKDTASGIVNLMIATDRPPLRESVRDQRLGLTDTFKDRGFAIALQLPNLEKASLLGEAILDRRHHLEKADFDRLHQSVAVAPEDSIPWTTLWNGWRRQQVFLYAVMRNEIERLEKDQSHNSNGSDLVDDGAMAARITTLELNSRALVDLYKFAGTSPGETQGYHKLKGRAGDFSGGPMGSIGMQRP